MNDPVVHIPIAPTSNGETNNSKLFREIASKSPSAGLEGAISLALPLRWAAISYFLLVIVLVAAVFLLAAQYSRSEVAVGTLRPAGGIPRVVPVRPGLIKSVFVTEGQKVKKGMPLVSISAETTGLDGLGVQSGIISAITDQQNALIQQQVFTHSAAIEEAEGYRVQVDGLRQQISDLREQAKVQQKLVSMAETDLARATEVASRGFISKRDLASREEALLNRKKQLLELNQAVNMKLAEAEQVAKAKNEASRKAKLSSAVITAVQAQSKQQRLGANESKGYSIVAPVSGTVAALTAHSGDYTNSQDVLMSIVPSSSRLIAEIMIPANSIGFVSPGQEVELAIDAYPYDHFGVVDARISSVSTAPLVRNNEKGVSTSFYLATAIVQRQTILAYGTKKELRPGMTFSARIIMEKRSLFQWLLDPIYAAFRL